MLTRERPLVSVILPTYNRASMLPRAISSALNYSNIELIVIDDCSSDETETVVRSFEDPRIIYERLEKNSGGSAARNFGIEISLGEFIAFLDDDDEWLPEKLSRQLAVFENGSSNLGLVYTGIIYWQNGSVGRNIPKHKGMIYNLQLREDHILSTSTWLVRKSCFEDDRVKLFDERLPARQDYDMSLRILRLYAVDFCAECLVRVYLDVPQRISRNPEKRVEGHLLVLDKIIGSNEMSPLRARMIKSSHYYSIARYYQDSSCIAESVQFLYRALNQWPLNLKALVFITLFAIGGDSSVVYRSLRRLKKFLERCISKTY
jgi:glycosyltransferase involved in cell wall biosynthesis